MTEVTHDDDRRTGPENDRCGASWTECLDAAHRLRTSRESPALSPQRALAGSEVGSASPLSMHRTLTDLAPRRAARRVSQGQAGLKLQQYRLNVATPVSG